MYHGFSRNRKVEEDVIVTFNQQKRLKLYTVILSVVSLIGALFYLRAFVNHFGSFAQFLVAGALVREDLFDGSIQIPAISVYTGLLSYSAINLSMVCYSKYGFRWFQLLPFLSVLIMSFSQASRAGIVILIFQFFAGKVFKLLIAKEKKIELKLFKPILILIPILLTIFVLVEAFRQQDFEVNASKAQESTTVLSIYAYGGVAGFTTYLKEIYPFQESITFGRYTFSSLYDMLGIAKAEPGIYDQYLSVSAQHSGNVYTIFRPLLEDFGYLGMSLWALLLGFFASRFFHSSTDRGSLVATSLCITIYTYLLFSFIAPLTQFNSFILSCFLCPFVIWFAKCDFLKPTEKKPNL